jgi:hypothetical protein
MGRILLVCRLVVRDHLRHRPTQAVLLLAITAATATRLAEEANGRSA